MKVVINKYNSNHDYFTLPVLIKKNKITKTNIQLNNNHKYRQD